MKKVSRDEPPSFRFRKGPCQMILFVKGLTFKDPCVRTMFNSPSIKNQSFTRPHPTNHKEFTDSLSTGKEDIIVLRVWKWNEVR